MKTKYLLPCSCGQEIPIDVSQAGQIVRCQCGAELEAPTLLRMQSLKRVGLELQTTHQRPRRWGMKQRLVLMGALVAIPAFALTVYLLLTRPKLAEVPTHAPLDTLTIGQTWLIWQDLRSGIQRRPTVAESYYQERLRRNRQWIGVAAVLGAAGLLVMASSLFVPKQRLPSPVHGTRPDAAERTDKK